VLDQIAAWGDALKAPADKRLKKQLRRDRSLPHQIVHAQTILRVRDRR
jgi:hypothetical protein